MNATEIAAPTVMFQSSEDAADEPVSERDALKLVLAADRELARAIDRCAGREALVAELQRARNWFAAAMRSEGLSFGKRTVSRALREPSIAAMKSALGARTPHSQSLSTNVTIKFTR